MGLFSTKEKPQAASFLDDEDLQPTVKPVDYNSALEYLVGLSDQDYATMCKVADIYRKADTEAAKALKKPVKPSTFIEPPLSEAEKDDLAIAEIISGPELAGESAFIETESKPKQIKVK